MTIENFRLKNFLKQDADLIKDYIIALQYLKPMKTNREIYFLKLKHVEFIKKNLYSNSDESLIKIVKIVQKIKTDEVLNMKIVEFFSIIASIKEQTNRILKAEERGLAPAEVNLKWELVEGSEKMAKFGIYNTLDVLTKEDATKYKYYMNMSYDEVFTILLKRKTASDLQAQMDKIKLKNQ